MALIGGDKKTSNNQTNNVSNDSSVRTTTIDNSVSTVTQTQTDLGAIVEAFKFASQVSTNSLNFGAKALDRNNDNFTTVAGLTKSISTGGQTETNKMIFRVSAVVGVVIAIGFVANALKGKK